MEPWARAMVAADEAEAAGDAMATLEVMEAFAVGPDGEPFWRPWRAKHLFQIAMLGPLLPRWATSRWLCNQAMQSVHEADRGRARRAFELAVQLRGGEANLPGRNAADAHGRVVDRDWVYRQLYLYELGGLQSFVRRQASSRLLSQADSIDEWARSPMGGYRLVGSTTDTVTWLDLAADRERTIPNIGSGCLLVPGEHVLGRLVPVEGGVLFETRPLLVSSEVAARVADSPADWLTILEQGSATEEQLALRHALPTLLTDVPTTAWELLLLGDTEPPIDGDEWAALLARGLLDVAALAMGGHPRRPTDGELDPWSCLAAAVVDPMVIVGMATAAELRDVPVLAKLGGLLAEPAASVCQGMAWELLDAA
jgi:hypothetical protein